MEKFNKKLAILILAAGKSSRLKDDTKQLLKYKDKTLIEIAVQKALKISKNVFVVLGYDKQRCENKIKKYNINILYNKNYDKGIGSSISFGINNTKDFEHTMIMLVDQPFIPLSHFESLRYFIKKGQLIASKYDNEPCVPAIFPKSLYTDLLKLKEDKGAKSILKVNNHISLNLNKDYAIDIDTKEDKNRFLN
ncbi:glycosyl transferase [Malaciobacter molluscorum LMG 25693]|uniref:Glycosyl transferase n=1 Tax=Malaciobacter molluscorum LMG 25693 TaxID=870501 RepID=A0A2G1DJM8_9BACT|nr:nucleotidyltransferase family protein [Malaciobacter molluscorum]AXX92843.1 molybdenum cofactor cytidylyltransferase [Malaciobacter molluscorum LMG 25693]PHO18682.1 glycosyl transferase [Malaciobacter molluscorum LMG 25693]